jgi:antitoxin VapB
MGEYPKAKLFMHGGSQAVRLPKAFRFDGVEVRIRKEGDKVILEPVKPAQSYGPEFWARIDALREAAGEDFPCPPPQPPAPDPLDL